MRATMSVFLLGLLFGAGLVISGMTQPAKVVNFLNIAGSWDASLAFVMGGAMGVNLNSPSAVSSAQLVAR